MKARHQHKNQRDFDRLQQALGHGTMGNIPKCQICHMRDARYDQKRNRYRTTCAKCK